MRILITGGSGFIGGNLINKILDKNEIVSISRNNQYKLKNVNWVKTNLSDFREIKQIIRNFEPEACIHLAWENIPKFDFENSKKNLNNSISLISALSKNSKCKKILISGSCLEYSPRKKLCNENNKIVPYDYFSWSKNSIYNFLKMKSHENEIDYSWFRIFYAYGPRQRNNSIIPSIIHSLINHNLPKINNPFNCNDFIYIDDVTNIFKKAINSKFKSGIYNIGNGYTVSILEILKILEKLICKSKRYYSLFKNYKNNSSVKYPYISDINKMNNQFNIKKLVNIEDGLAKTLKFYKQNL